MNLFLTVLTSVICAGSFRFEEINTPSESSLPKYFCLDLGLPSLFL